MGWMFRARLPIIGKDICLERLEAGRRLTSKYACIRAGVITNELGPTGLDAHRGLKATTI